MYELYFLERYRTALKLAGKATSEAERSVHRRTVRIYLALLLSCARNPSRRKGPVRSRH